MKLRSILLLSGSMLMFGNSFGQSLVSTGTYKYTLLEEGTGTWCGYCPDGAQRIQQNIEPTYPHAIAVAFHNGDAMTLSPDQFNSAYIGSPAGLGWPGGSIDRVPFTHLNTSSGVNETRVWVNRGYWASDLATRDAVSPNFKISMLSTWDSSTSTLKVNVTAKVLIATGAAYNINAYLVEDSISSATTGYEQHSYMYSGPTSSWFYNLCSSPCPSYACSSCAIIPSSSYSHMGVVRKIMGADIYGDAAFTSTAAVGDSITKTYTYTIPSTFNWHRCKVVGLVTKAGTGTDTYGAYNDRAVQNSIRANVKGMYKLSPLDVNTSVQTLDEISIIPNPAKDFINVQCSFNTLTPGATTVTIVNAAGQTIMSKNYDPRGSLFMESISLNGIANGNYFLTISGNGATATRQFVVNR